MFRFERVHMWMPAATVTKKINVSSSGGVSMQGRAVETNDSAIEELPKPAYL